MYIKEVTNINRDRKARITTETLITFKNPVDKFYDINYYVVENTQYGLYINLSVLGLLH